MTLPDRLEQMTDDAFSLLREVRAFNKGEGAYNFSGLLASDRNNASYDAWENIAGRIDAALRARER